MADLHFDDAMNYLIDQLAKVPPPSVGRARARQSSHGADVWIDQISAAFWATRSVTQVFTTGDQDEKEPYVAPFYDAAWELCRRGVLRPGSAVAAGQTSTGQIGQRINGAPFFGDGYSLTQWGREWVKKTVAERPIMPTDAGRLTTVLLEFKTNFGDGYAQRAAEAVSDWRAGNYLSACVMAGAAAESILLATAIQKTKDEARVLSLYQGTQGRSRTVKLIVDSADKVLGERFKLALGVLSYWRDEAAHGTASAIGEVDAHEALSRLLSLARLASDNWIKLTARGT